MEALGITDYGVYNRQPQDILDARRAIRSERARLRKVETDRMKAELEAARGRR
jgi:hypothetical protein